MATSRDEVKRRYKQGQKTGKRYLFVVCDTFSYEDYPVYKNNKDRECDESNMERIMDRIDLSKPYRE